MCGISGFFLSNNFSTHRESLKTLRNMTNVLRHRGPDASGYWSSERDNIYLGHRRLSIIDLSKSANQPMNSRDDRCIIIFNGEIYNFKQLKSELQSLFNVKFKTQSDTEVILELVTQFGFKKALDKIIGMFSLVIWDKKEKNLFLAIDPLGKKPLYWAEEEKGLIFASEIKSILKFKNFKKILNHQSLSEFFKFSYIKAPNTIFKGINKLEPGTYLMFSKELKVKKFRYWNPKNFLYSSKDFIRNENTVVEELHEILNISVSERLIAGVPLAVSEVPGSKDLVQNNKNGFIVSKNNAQQFVDVIINFYNNKNLLNRIKKNCVNSVKYYDWEKVSVKYIDLYKKIIKETNIKKLI